MILFANSFSIRTVVDLIDGKEQLRGVVYFNTSNKTDKDINAFLTKLASEGNLSYLDFLQELSWYRPQVKNNLLEHLYRIGGYGDILKAINRHRKE